MTPTPGASALPDADLLAILGELGQPAWRLRQMREALWQSHHAGFADIRQLPAGLREALERRLRYTTAEVAQASEADHGNTVKLLIRLHDGQTVETVAMETSATERHHRRTTVCVSSQVGCAVGCPFCATGQMGLRRNCTAAEIIDQVRAASKEMQRRALGPVTHVVYMGMGEPLANYDPVVRSLRVLARDGGISPRRITVSTSGVVPAIERLAGERIPATLAVSLHAATDELRDRLVPLNRTHPMEQLLDASGRYAATTGRRLSLEWCLIGDVNDSDEQADGLAGIAAGLRAHVNVIPMNHIEGSPWGPPSRARTRRFLGRLDGARTTVRDTRGGETDAACGQLRANLTRRRIPLADGTLSRPRTDPATG